MVALEQLPRELRSAFSALWDLDLAFADVVSTSSDPRLGAIRLAWWRERLEELDEGKGVPSEPRLQAVAAQLLQRGVKGRQLSQLEDAWLPLLEPFPWGQSQADALKLRGSILFGIGAWLLGSDEHATEAIGAGAIWSLVDGARHCSEPASCALMMDEARSVLMAVPMTMPRRLRALTVPAALAASGLFGEPGSLGRLKAALFHRLLGTFPRS